MKKQAFVLTLGVVLVAVAVSMGMLITARAQWGSPGYGAGGPGHGGTAAGDYRLSGPYTHRNLTIFLVHGKNTIKAKSFLTLQEALVQKKVAPPSVGTFPVSGGTFLILLLGTVILIGALNFLPALTLGPIVEHFLTSARVLF